MAKVTVLQGAAGTGKTRAVLERYREHVGVHGVASALMLLPHPRAVSRAHRALVVDHDLPGVFGPLIMTFPELASRLLDENGETATEASPVIQRMILREAVDRVRQRNGLRFLEPVADFEGLLNVLTEFIEELKRGAIDEATFALRLEEAGYRADRDADLSAIYSQYQGLLHELQLFDPAGRFWWAREVLRSGRRRPFEQVMLLLVDGFDDFTPTQLQVLELLAQEAEELVFTLGIEPGDARSELFRAPRETLDRLQETFPGLQMISRERANAGASPLAFIRSHLFRELPEISSPDGQVRIIEAPGRAREVREIAREVKWLLSDPALGCKADDIGIVFRSLGEYAPLLRGVFQEFGIPLHVASSEPLGRTPLGRTVLQMVRLVAEDFPRDLLVGFLRSGYVRLPGQDKHLADELDRLARAAGVIGGAQQWLDRLRAHQRRLGRFSEFTADEDPEQSQGRLEGAGRDIPLLGQCIELTEEAIGELAKLATPCSLEGLVKGVWRLMLHFDVGRFSEPGGRASTETDERLRSGHARRDVLALDALLDTLDAVAFAARRREGPDALLSVREFLDILTDAFRTAGISPDGRHEGKVSALEAHDARQLQFRFVLIGGLLEREFPRQRREGVFYRDDERRALAKKGLNLQQRLERQAEEMYLFYQAASRATERLYLTYPVTDEEGREVLRSAYVDEVLALFGGEEGLPLKRVRPSDVSVGIDQAATPTELLEATHGGLAGRADGSPSDLVAAYNALAENSPGALVGAAWGAHIEGRRDSKAPFDEFDGVLTDDAVVGSLRERFAPDYRFSASALSDYGSCPFQYFANRVLKLEPLEEPAEEVEAHRRGGLYHAVLKRFFERLKEDFGSTSVTDGNLDAVRPVMQAVVNEVFEKEAARAVATSRTLLEIERGECLLSMERFLEDEIKRSAGRQPVLFEAEFGMEPAESPLQIGPDDDKVLLRGRIDRIDVIADLPEPAERGEPDLWIAVMDYKTGDAPSAKAIELGTDLQLPIYALAAEQLLFPQRSPYCQAWTYRRVRRPVGLRGQVVKEDELAQLKETATKHALTHAAGIRGGQFPVAPRDDRCRYCDFRAMCRYQESRTRNKLQAEEENA